MNVTSTQGGRFGKIILQPPRILKKTKLFPEIVSYLSLLLCARGIGFY